MTAMKLDKDKNKSTQRARLLLAFSRTPKTMLQVAKMTNIERANVCRLLAELEDKNLIELVKFGICPITKHRAGFYRTIERKKNDDD